MESEPSLSDDTTKKCKNLEDLHKYPDIKDDWLKSVQGVIDVLNNCANCLFLKDEPFMVLLYSACCFYFINSVNTKLLFKNCSSNVWFVFKHLLFCWFVMMTHFQVLILSIRSLKIYVKSTKFEFKRLIAKQFFF